MQDEYIGTNSSVGVNTGDATKKTFFSNLRDRITKIRQSVNGDPRKSVAVIIVMGLLLVGAVYALQRNNYIPELTSNLHDKNFLIVLQTTPSEYEDGVGSSTNIIFNFNHPVDPEDFQSSFSISPNISGEFRQGVSKNTVIFDPSRDFDEGEVVKITIFNDLQSVNGKMLISEFNLTFYIDVNAKSVIFRKDYLNGRFVGAQTNKETSFELIVGRDIDSEGVINIYKADVPTLLESLIYGEKEIKNGDSSYKLDDFGDKGPDTKKMSFLERRVGLKDQDKFNLKKETGLYFVEAVSKDVRVGSVWVSFNEIGILLRQDDQKIVLASQNLITGSLENSVDVTFYSLRDKVTILKQDKLGSKKEFLFPYPQQIDLIVGLAGSDVIVIPVSIIESQADLRVNKNLSEKDLIFLYTDRPIYKKGDTVKYRGVLRRDNDGLYKLPLDSEDVKVWILDEYDIKKPRLIDQTVSVDKSGIFYGEFTIPDKLESKDPTLYNTAYLYASVVKPGASYDYGTASAYFDVVAYKKPSFSLSVELDRHEYIRKDKISAKIIGANLDGTPLANQTVNYIVYSKDYYETERAIYNQSFKINSWGGMCGGSFGGFDEYFGEEEQSEAVTTLNSSGEAVITFDADLSDRYYSQEITVLATKQDGNGNKVYAAQSRIVHQGEYNLFFRPGRRVYQSGEETFNTFYLESLAGEKLPNKTVDFQMVKSEWSILDKKMVESTLDQGSVTTDSQGLATIKSRLNGSTAGIYLRVSLSDSRGNIVRGSEYLSLVDSTNSQDFGPQGDELTILDIISEKSSLAVGENINLKVKSTSSLDVLVSYERGRIYRSDWVRLNQGENNLSFTVDENLSPSFTLVFSFFKDGKYRTEGLSFNVPAMHKLIDVEIRTDQTRYKPGEKAKITITTKDKSGQGVPASISVDIVDKAIFSLRKNAAPPIHSSFFFYRGRDTNASSSMTGIGSWEFGGGGGGGGDQIDATKLPDTLYWNPNLQTDQDGELMVEVPLSELSTTWRILVHASTDSTDVGQNSFDFVSSVN